MTPNVNGGSSRLNEFVKGFAWGFVGFVHVALVTVLIFKFRLNCLPSNLANIISCIDPGSASCPKACAASDDLIFYALLGVTLLDAILMPVGLGLFFAFRKPRA